MAVFRDQDSSGYRFEVRPNCALSWRSTKLLFLFFTCCLGAVACYFVFLGAWFVLPFAGLELVVLGAGLYLNALSGHTREVIKIDGPVLRVLRGRRQLEEIARFPANWSWAVLQRDPTGWYPSRLLLGCHGKGLEVGSKLVEHEREELAEGVQELLGFRQPQADGLMPGRSAGEQVSSGLGLPVQTLHGAAADAHAMTGTALASIGARAAGCASGAVTEK